MKRETELSESVRLPSSATARAPQRRPPRWRQHVFDAGVTLASIAERLALALANAAVGVLDEASFCERTAAEDRMRRRATNEIFSGLFWWETSVYATYIEPGDRLLIVGAGTGRDVIALAAAGYDVVGLDPLPEVLAIAREHLQARKLSATLVEGAIGNPGVMPGWFDVVIFSDNMYSALPSSAKRVAALAQARDHLAPRGRVIVPYFGTPAPLPQRAYRIARLTAWLTGSDVRLEEGDVVRTRGPLGKELHYHHVFTAAEIEDEARRAGLRVAYHRRPPDVPTVVLTV